LPGLDAREEGILEPLLSPAQRTYVENARALVGEVAPGYGDFQWGFLTEGPRSGHVAIFDPPVLTPEELQNAQAPIQRFLAANPRGGARLTIQTGDLLVSGSGDLAVGGLKDTNSLLALEATTLALWQLNLDLTSPFQVRVAIADLPSGELGEAFITQFDYTGRHWMMRSSPIPAPTRRATMTS